MLSNYYTKDAPLSVLNRPDTLTVVTFDGKLSGSQPGLIPTGLESTVSLCEVWKSPNRVVERGELGTCSYSRCEDYLICEIQYSLDEDGLSAEEACFAAYQSLLGAVDALGYRHTLRFWNYLPGINSVPAGQLEIYKQFCVGRHRAFVENSIPPEDFPAASALGSGASKACAYVLAGKSPGVHFENKRQQSAYHYPPQYGPSSPSFSRATALQGGTGLAKLFVSGTASVIGHTTYAPNDIRSQMDTTMGNIDFLIEDISNAYSIENFKIYIRNRDDRPYCKSFISDRYPDIPAIYLYADICRSDLLVEVEAVCGLRAKESE